LVAIAFPLLFNRERIRENVDAMLDTDIVLATADWSEVRPPTLPLTNSIPALCGGYLSAGVNIMIPTNTNTLMINGDWSLIILLAQRCWGQQMRNLVLAATIFLVFVTGCASTKV
jgi:hypothetical protein